MFTKSIIAIALAGSSFAFAADRDASMVYFEQQVGLQRKIVVETQAALDKAIESKSNSVHLGKDLLNTIAYGVSTGVITYDFMNGTNAVGNVQRFWNNLGTKAPTTSSVSKAQAFASESAVKAEAAGATSRAVLYRKIGVTAYRTTQAVSAAVLGVFFVGDLYQLGDDAIIKYSDTHEIAQLRANLAQAQRNLHTADQNLQTAVIAGQM